jgi:hypothetical protein
VVNKHMCLLLLLLLLLLFICLLHFMKFNVKPGEHLGFRGWDRKPGAGKNSEGRLYNF